MSANSFADWIAWLARIHAGRQVVRSATLPLNPVFFLFNRVAGLGGVHAGRQVVRSAILPLISFFFLLNRVAGLGGV